MPHIKLVDTDDPKHFIIELHGHRSHKIGHLWRTDDPIYEWEFESEIMGLERQHSDAGLNSIMLKIGMAAKQQGID